MKNDKNLSNEEQKSRKKNTHSVPEMVATCYDLETTGLIDNGTLKINKQPYVIEMYGCVVNLKTGEVFDEINTFVRPPKSELITPEITRITGITYDMVKDAPMMAQIAPKIFDFIEKSKGPIIAHNLSYDKEMIDIEARRLGRTIKWPKRLLCTVEQTIYLKGFRLNLSGLHELLFEEKFEGAHRAKADVAALTRCCVELHKRGLL